MTRHLPSHPDRALVHQLQGVIYLKSHKKGRKTRERGGRSQDVPRLLVSSEPQRGVAHLIRVEFQEVLNSDHSKREEESDPKRSADTGKIEHGQRLESTPSDGKQDSTVRTGVSIHFRGSDATFSFTIPLVVPQIWKLCAC